MNQTVPEAQAALDAAIAASLEHSRRDIELGEGSHNQERRREQKYQELEDHIWQCEQALLAAKQREAGNADRV